LEFLSSTEITLELGIMNLFSVLVSEDDIDSYRAFPIDVEQNKEYAKTKLEMSILAIGASARLGNITVTSMQKVANNVTAEVIPYCRGAS
jgi:hypothetical protein